MENAKNRWYYKLSEEQSNNYMKCKKDYIRFLIRIPSDKMDQFKSIDGFSNLITQTKNHSTEHVESRDKVIKLDFDIIPYGNGNAREMICNHSVLITTPEYKQEVIDKILSNFVGATCKNSGKNAVTTQLYTEPLQRGIWSDVNTTITNNIKYPICILSYGRYNKYGKTHLYLTKCKIHHYLFVEPCEYDLYLNWYNNEYCNLIKCPRNFHLDKMGGSVVRNYILKWGKDLSYDRVWMLDDNIKNYMRFLSGVKNEIQSKEIFTSIENYIERYNNVGLVSHNFCPYIMEHDCRPCIVKNGKCYSSMLIKTDIGITFDGKYNEDVLISIDTICKGYCNLCFNHILYNKDTSGSNKGGNQSLYKDHTQQGYKDKYEYLYYKLKILHMEGKLQLIDGKGVDDFIKRDKNMKSKEYHHNIEYQYLYNNEVDIVKKDNYQYIVDKQLPSNLILN
tara:strand:+ start:982 stop:2328 length:1347 start_codon:yes stop_codon:yes gene_type:complete